MKVKDPFKELDEVLEFETLYYACSPVDVSDGLVGVPDEWNDFLVKEIVMVLDWLDVSENLW